MKPAANLFAMRSTDPRLLGKVRSSLEISGQWTAIEIVGPWIAAASPLPATRVEQCAATGEGTHLYIAEGHSVLAGWIERNGGPPAWSGVADRALHQPETVRRLPGDFGFLALGEDGSAAAVRSCGGVVPFHVYEGGSASPGGIVAVATTIADLLRFVPEPLRPDQLVWAAAASGSVVFPDHRSYLEGARAIPRGHVCVVAASGAPDSARARMVRYFDPRPPSWSVPDREKREEHAERLRSMLFSTLEEELDPAGTNLLALSGGVDSSCLGAIAAATLGFPVATVSLLPPPGQPAEEVERGYVESLNDMAGFVDQLKIPLTLPELLLLNGEVTDVGFPMPHAVFASLGRVAERGLSPSMIFGGEYADSVCGAEITMPDWAMATSFCSMLRSLASPPFSRIKDPLRWSAWHVFWPLRRPRTYMVPELVGAFVPEIRDEYREFQRRHRAEVPSPGPWRFLSLWDTQDGWVGSGWEVASAQGMRRCLPFHTRGMIELVYDCHPSELVGPGSKLLLKRALDGLVPSSHLYRPANNIRLVPDYRKPLPWGRILPDVVAPLVTEEWRSSPPTAVYPEIYPLNLLDRAGRAFEALSATTLDRSLRGTLGDRAAEPAPLPTGG